MLRRSISSGYHPGKMLLHGIIVIKNGITVIKIITIINAMEKHFFRMFEYI
jgi:hypothetical protein